VPHENRMMLVARVHFDMSLRPPCRPRRAVHQRVTKIAVNIRRIEADGRPLREVDVAPRHWALSFSGDRVGVSASNGDELETTELANPGTRGRGVPLDASGSPLPVVAGSAARTQSRSGDCIIA
jgi:hypothetical protein